MRKYIEENKINIIVALLTIFVAILPLLQNNLVIGDDYEYHLARIQSISDSLKSGMFPVKIYSQLANTYGYGSGLFYPDLFLYVPALLEIIGFNLIFSYKIFIVLMLFFMFIITYFSIKHITDEENSALIGSVFVILSRVLILNLYHRCALGEFLGYMFITPVIAGMFDFVHKDFKNPMYLFLGFFGLVNTHLISTIICLCFCVIYFFINIKKIIKNWKNILKLFILAIVVLLSTCSFWLPMLEQYEVQDYKFSVPWTSIQNDEYRLIDVLGFGRYSLGVPIVLFIPILLIEFFNYKDKKNSQFFILSICIILLQTTNIFWNLTSKYSNIIQFKWRLLCICTVLFAISDALFIKEICKRNKIKVQYIVLVVFLISSYFTIDFMYYNSKNDDVLDVSNFNSKCVYNFEFALGGGKEYLPLETKEEELNNPNFAISSNDEKISLEKNNLSLEFYSNIDTDYFDIPFIYYKGYVANITEDDGKVRELKIRKNENTGTVRIYFSPEYSKGKIRVWYNGTKVQKLSLLISCVMIIIIVFYTIGKLYFPIV